MSYKIQNFFWITIIKRRDNSPLRRLVAPIFFKQSCRKTRRYLRRLFFAFLICYGAGEKSPFEENTLSALKEKMPEFSAEAVEEAYAELKELYDAGMLFSTDDYEQYSDLLTTAPVKAMCLNIAHDCNLRCKYCFASTGDYAGGRKLMSEKVGKAAIDFLIQSSGARKNLEVDFFGGEPLMNIDVVKKVVEYARSKEKEYNKNFRFTMTTNGMLLDDEITDFLNKEMSNVVLSIDGRKEINDANRPTPNGKGSYDIIMPKYKELVKRRGADQYYVRGTFTRDNLDFGKDVLHLNDEGFDQISVEPAVTDPDKPYSLREEDLPRIFAEYENLALEIIRRKKEGTPINFFHFMIDLNQGPCAIKRLRGCGCGNEYVAVTPDGGIYPCHQFVGLEEWKMGNVLDGSFSTELKKSFAHSNIYTRKGCKDCWAKFYCSGGCNANSLLYAGDLQVPHHLSCEMEKKRVECAIMIQAALADAQVEDSAQGGAMPRC
jgi:uncharacterized protein